MNKDISEVEFTIFDTETTGLDPGSGDRIVEIAGIRIKGDERLGSFQSLINSGKEISQGAYQVNRISADMLKDAPKSEQAIPEFLNFSAGSCLCSYNAGFDWGFLNNELRLIGHARAEYLAVLDILRMARRSLPGLERYALWFVAQSLGIKVKQAHRAFSDVELTWDVFKRLKEIIAAKGISDINNYSSLFGIDPEILADLNMQKISRIREAIDLKMNLQIKYLSTAGALVSERRVTPKEIKKDGVHTYLVGYCFLRKEERTFRIDGILHLEIV